MADAIESRSRDILAANAQDVEASRIDGLSAQLMQRLLLTESKVLFANSAHPGAHFVTLTRLRIS
jgi:gamma-glutamyl phosphate reductase